MKTTIKLSLLCSLLFFTKIGYAQNSSYPIKDSIAPLSVYQLANKLVSIDYDSIEEVNLMLSYISRYTKHLNLNLSEKVIVSDSNQFLIDVYRNLISASYDKSVLITFMLNDANKDRLESLKLYENYKGLSEKFESNRNRKFEIISLTNSLIRYINIKKNDTTSNYEPSEYLRIEWSSLYPETKIIFLQESKGLKISVDDFSNLLTKVYESKAIEINKINKSQKSIIDSIYNKLLANNKEDLKKIKKIPGISNEYSLESLINNETSTSSNSITIQLSQVESSAEPNYNLSLPSEAEMIDAVAVYLATRVKQEAALWFFDEMKRNAEMYDLLQVFFPNTIDIIQSEDYYKSPTIGTGWQYALARDFTKMPGNVINSDWFTELISKYENGAELHKYLKVSVDLAHFYREKFSYKDIVKQLYLNQDKYANAGTKGLKSQPLICSINLLYILSNEFQFYYANDKKKFVSRELDFEDLERMTPEAFSIMISLLNIKYDGIFAEVFYNYKSSTIKENKKLFSRWFSRVKITMNQFNKLVKQVNSLNENSRKDEKVYEYYNTWLLFTELVESLDFEDNNLFKLDSNNIKNYKKGKSLIKKSFETYEMIDRKNYVGATNNMLEILDIILVLPHTKEKSEVCNYSIDTTEIDYNSAFSYNHAMQLYNRETSNLENNKLVYYWSCTDKIDLSKILKNSDLEELKNGKKVTVTFKMEDDDFKHPKLKITFVKSKSKIGSIDNLSGLITDNELYKAIHKVKNLASFLADLSETKSSKDIKKIIDAYALPPGSYKRKRNTWHTLDLNAYVGGFLGYEINSSAKTSQSNSANNLDPGFNYGISAPIGFTYTFNFGRKISYKTVLGNKYKNNPDLLKIKLNNKKIRVIDKTRSFSVGLSIFDLGAAVSYRFSYDNSDTTNSNTNAILSNKVRWEQFFSPGVHLSWGIKNTPLVLRAGAQFTPSIRRIRTAQDIEEYKNMFRFYGGVFFDLPIYNIWRNTSITKY